MIFFDQTFSGTMTVTGYFLGQRIQVKDIPGISPTGGRAYVMVPPAGGMAYIFRYGAVVLFGMAAEQQRAFLEATVMPHMINPVQVPETEHAVMVVEAEGQGKVSFEHISVPHVTPVMLEVVSDIIAKTSVLAYYERKAMEIFDLLEPVSENLENGTYPSARRSKLFLKHIGMALGMRRKMVGQVEVTDKPEVLWEQSAEVNRFYGRLEDEYEIIERHTALKEKLETIHDTAETMVDLLQTRQSLRVEWYIVLLIVFDIVLSLWEKMGGHLVAFLKQLLLF